MLKAIDTETTGVSASCEVIQLGVLAPDGSALMDTYLRPQAPIHPEAAKVHKITAKRLQSAPTFPEIFP